MLALDLQRKLNQNPGLLVEPHTAFILPHKGHCLKYLIQALKMLPWNLEASQLLYDFYPFWYELLPLILHRSPCYRRGLLEDIKIHGFQTLCCNKAVQEEEGAWGARDDKSNTSQHKLLPAPAAKCEMAKASESMHKRECVSTKPSPENGSPVLT